MSVETLIFAHRFHTGPSGFTIVWPLPEQNAPLVGADALLISTSNADPSDVPPVAMDLTETSEKFPASCDANGVFPAARRALMDA
jgi:hypothetical protein